MGRQAKRKQKRRNQKEVTSSPSPQIQTHDQSFIRQMERQGYNLKQIQHSPEVPEDKPEPQV